MGRPGRTYREPDPTSTAFSAEKAVRRAETHAILVGEKLDTIDFNTVTIRRLKLEGWTLHFDHPTVVVERRGETRITCMFAVNPKGWGKYFVAIPRAKSVEKGIPADQFCKRVGISVVLEKLLVEA